MFLGDMGLARARALCNYARRLVLPILGLEGNYDQPEIDLDQKTDETQPHEIASGENKEGSENSDEGSENSDENSENGDENSEENDEIDESAGWL